MTALGAAAVAPGAATPSVLAVALTLGSTVAKASVLRGMGLVSLRAVGAGPCCRLDSLEADADRFGTNMNGQNREEAGLGRERSLIEMQAQQIAAKPMWEFGANIYCQSVLHGNTTPGALFPCLSPS